MNEPVQHSRLFDLAKQAEDLMNQRRETEARIAKLKQDYEQARQQALQSLANTAEKLEKVSQLLVIETQGLSTEARPVSVSAPKRTRGDIEKAFGPVIWRGKVSTRVMFLRDGLVRWLKNRPSATVAEFRKWYMEQGGTSASAYALFAALKVWAKENKWEVTENPAVLHRPAQLDLAAATPEDKARFLEEIRTNEEVLR